MKIQRRIFTNLYLDLHSELLVIKKERLYLLYRMVPCVALVFTVKWRTTVVFLTAADRLLLAPTGWIKDARGCSFK